jgi:hypothetical protein
MTAVSDGGAEGAQSLPGMTPLLSEGGGLFSDGPDLGVPTDASTVVTGTDDGPYVTLGGLCAPGDGGVDNGSATRCGCTRRPGPGEDPFNCPQGIGQYATTVLGPDGGNLQLKGQEFMAIGAWAQITLAARSVSQPTSVGIEETAIPPPAPLLDWSPVYRFDVGGATLQKPALIQIPWSNLSGMVPHDITIYFSTDGACFSALANAQGNAGFMTVETTAMGYFLVGATRTALTASCP